MKYEINYQVCITERSTGDDLITGRDQLSNNSIFFPRSLLFLANLARDSFLLFTAKPRLERAGDNAAGGARDGGPGPKKNGSWQPALKEDVGPEVQGGGQRMVMAVKVN